MWVANFIAAWLVLGVLLNVAQTRGAPEQTLRWVEAIDRTALCNDRTRAGYFISRNLDLSDPASNKWVIFLESGGLCFSNDTCNRRFFNTEVSLICISAIYSALCVTVSLLLYMRCLRGMSEVFLRQGKLFIHCLHPMIFLLDITRYATAGFQRYSKTVQFMLLWFWSVWNSLWISFFLHA